MSDNRYSPPKALVEDVLITHEKKERPRQVVLAVRLGLINYALGALVMVVSWDYYSRLQSIGATLFGQLLTLVMTLWIFTKVYQGRNWARITLLVLALLFGLLCLSSAFRNSFIQIVSAAPAVAKVH